VGKGEKGRIGGGGKDWGGGSVTRSGECGESSSRTNRGSWGRLHQEKGNEKIEK